MSKVRPVATATIIDFCPKFEQRQAANVERAMFKAASITPPFEHYATVGYLIATGGYPERQQLPMDVSAIDEVINSLETLRSAIIHSANKVSNPQGDIVHFSQFIAS